jgi:phosphomevalonate decarboxylase
LFQGRVAYIDGALERMRAAVKARDMAALAAIAEEDTLNLHAVTMTGASGLVVWQPATVAVIHQVRSLREDGVPVWFSIDTGATAYLNTTADHEDDVAGAVKDIDGVEEVLHLRPAGPARVVEDHLF